MNWEKLYTARQARETTNARATAAIEELPATCPALQEFISRLSIHLCPFDTRCKGKGNWLLVIAGMMEKEFLPAQE